MSVPLHASSLASAPPCATPAEDERWFKEEVQSHEPLLRAYLRRKFPQLNEVDDVVQESFPAPSTPAKPPGN